MISKDDEFDYPPDQMRFLKDGETPTFDMIRNDLGKNPPGTPVFNLQMDFAYNSTFYIPFLLTRLEQAERPCWRKAFDAIGRLVRRKPQSERIVVRELVEQI